MTVRLDPDIRLVLMTAFQRLSRNNVICESVCLIEALLLVCLINLSDGLEILDILIDLLDELVDVVLKVLELIDVCS